MIVLHSIHQGIDQVVVIASSDGSHYQKDHQYICPIDLIDS